MKYAFPANYGENCILLPIDKALVPIIAGALRPFEQRYSWLSEEDYERGYNAFAELQANMAGNCVRELIESNNRLYRLLDTALNGTQYTAAAPDPVTGDQVVTPEIPAAPPADVTAPAALRAQLARLHQLAENAATGAAYAAGAALDGTPALDYAGSWRARLEALQGEINEGWFGIGGQPATIADVVEALRIGTPQDAERIDTALEALSAASSTSVVFSTVRSLLADVVSGGLEGATLGTLIASSIANAAMFGQLAGQLDRLIKSLDGGGLVAPADNVVSLLDEIRDKVQ